MIPYYRDLLQPLFGLNSVILRPINFDVLYESVNRNEISHPIDLPLEVGHDSIDVLYNNEVVASLDYSRTLAEAIRQRSEQGFLTYTRFRVKKGQEIFANIVTDGITEYSQSGEIIVDTTNLSDNNEEELSSAYLWDDNFLFITRRIGGKWSKDYQIIGPKKVAWCALDYEGSFPQVTFHKTKPIDTYITRKVFKKRNVQFIAKIRCHLIPYNSVKGNTHDQLMTHGNLISAVDSRLKGQYWENWNQYLRQWESFVETQEEGFTPIEYIRISGLGSNRNELQIQYDKGFSVDTKYIYLSVRLSSVDSSDLQSTLTGVIGTLVHIDEQNRIVLIRFPRPIKIVGKRYFVDSEEVPQFGYLTISTSGDKGQIRTARTAVEMLSGNFCVNERLGEFIPDIKAIPAQGYGLDRMSENVIPDDIRNNPKQMMAFKGAVASEDLYLIQGPPGTGKTRLIAALVEWFVRNKKKVLIASYQHTAVDEVLNRIEIDAKIPISPLRLLSYYKEPSKESLRWDERNATRQWQYRIIKKSKEYFQAMTSLSANIVEWIEYPVMRSIIECYSGLSELSLRTQNTNYSPLLYGEINDHIEIVGSAISNQNKLTDVLEEGVKAIYQFLLKIEFYSGNVLSNLFTQDSLNTIDALRIILDEVIVLIEPLEGSSAGECVDLLYNYGRLSEQSETRLKELIGFLQNKERSLNEFRDSINTIPRDLEESVTVISGIENLLDDLLWMKPHSFFRSKKQLRKMKGKKLSLLTRDRDQSDTSLEDLRNKAISLLPQFVSTSGRLKQLSDEINKYNKAHQEVIDNYVPTFRKLLPKLDSLIASYDELIGISSKENQNSQITARISEVMSRYWNRMRVPRSDLRKVFVSSVDVVASTCYHIATDRDFSSMKFDVAIIDEAARAKAIDVIIPMVRAKKNILVGDHKQLEPIISFQEDTTLPSQVVNDETTDDDDFFAFIKQRSLFEYLFKEVDDRKECKQYLTKQFRMHPAIRELVSRLYYDDTLEDGDVIDDFVTPLLRYSGGKRIYLHRISGKLRTRHKSLANDAEIQAVRDLLRDLMQEWNRHKENAQFDVGVLSMYKYQEEKLQKELVSFKNNPKMDLKVGTVDSFQGHQKEHIIISFVGNIPTKFLCDQHRLNVALSRARKMLFLIGNFDRLRKSTAIGNLLSAIAGINAKYHD